MKRLNKKEEEDEKCLLLAGPQCGDFRNVSNDVVVLEAFLHAVQHLRKKTGIDFGAVAFDDCYSSLHITSVLSDFLSGLVPFDKVGGSCLCSCHTARV